MELLYSSMIITLITYFIFKLKQHKSHKKSPLPPGPWQLPIIGSIHHMIGGLPHRIFRNLSLIHGPIMHIKLGETSTIIISSADAAREVMKTHDINFSSRPMMKVVKIISYDGKSLIFAPYGEYWRQLRKICVLELLSTRRVMSFHSIRADEVMSLVRNIASSSSPVNISELINLLTNDITVRAVIGNKCEDKVEFLAALNASIEAAGGFDLADLFPSSRVVNWLSGSSRHLWGLRRTIDRILDGIIKEHREKRAAGNPADDLLDALLRLQESGDPEVPLCEDSLKAVMMDIFGAGSETSATTITWAMTELVRHPRVMKKAQSEIRELLVQNNEGRPLLESDTSKLTYMNLVIKETMRLHVPVPLLIPRECRNTCEVMGYEIPVKARLMVNAWAMGRDNGYWGEDAEEFRPERFEGSDVDYKGLHYEFLPFGAGRRICPGMSFGVANVEHALAQLLCYFDWEIPGRGRPEDIDLEEKFGATAGKKNDLCLRAIPCIHVP